RDDVRPPRVHTRDTATRGRFVDHVVVVERAEVHELDRARAGDRVVARRERAVDGVGGAKREHGPQALAARAEQVGGDFTEEAILGAHAVRKASLDPLQVAREGGEADILDEAHSGARVAEPTGGEAQPEATVITRKLAVNPEPAGSRARLPRWVTSI